MSADPPPQLVFVSLLRDPEDAAGLSGFLEQARRPERASSVRFAVAPVRGLDFLASERHQEEVDRWWATTVPDGAHPVYLVMHEDGLEEWVEGLDGTFYVGVPEGAGEPGYPESPAVRMLVADGPLDFAGAVLADFGGTGDAGVFDDATAKRISTLTAGVSLVPEPPSAEPAAAGIPAVVDGREQCHPFDLLMAAPPEAPSLSAPPPPPPPAPGRHSAESQSEPREIPASRRSVPFTWPRRRGGSEWSPRECAGAAVARGSTIVVMGSRKGGVGKTSHAAGVAIVAGEILDLFGHRAAIVDANIANPDAWGHLNLPAGAASVREVVAALTSDREPPPPVHAVSPALACYPESRETTEYSRTDVSILAAYLRRRYTLIVVDMSNRLPDPLAGPEAAAAAYWLQHSDVLVLPTASSKEDFNGVLDYLDVQDLPPVVVPYIVPGMRRNREHPLTREYLEAISRRVYHVVAMPDEADKVRYASMQGVPVQQVSAPLRGAYRELLAAIVRVPQRSRE